MNFGFAILTGIMATMTAGVISSEPRRLSELQVEQVLADAAAKREANEQVAPEHTVQVHGELGVMLGTGGHRGVFGTAVVPLGDRGDATLSISTEKGRVRHGGGYDERGALGRHNP